MEFRLHSTNETPGRALRGLRLTHILDSSVQLITSEMRRLENQAEVPRASSVPSNVIYLNRAALAEVVTPPDFDGPKAA